MHRRFRLRVTLLAAAVAGAPMVAVTAPALATHSSQEVGHDPHKYTIPHAGVVAPPRGSGRLAPPTGALLGTHSDDSHSGPIDAETQGIIRTEHTSGRIMDINNSYYGNFEKIANDYIPGSATKRGLSKLAFWDVEMGRIPLISWGCGKSTDIAAGRKDEVIRKTAQAMKAFGHEFMLRYCWEMDGSKRTTEVGDPSDFVAAWIRVWNLFREEGAGNVVWVWTANANGFKNRNTKGAYAWEYYPGDEYVDWVAADGYNWGASYRNEHLAKDRWRGFVEIFDEFMAWARSTGPVPDTMVDPSRGVPTTFPRKTQVKPIQIGEYGAIEPEGEIREELLAVAPYNTKADWLRETHDTVNGSKPRTAQCPWCGMYSDIAAMVYFDIVGPNGPWIINSSEESKAAWRESAAQDPWFQQIHTIGWGPASVRSDIPKPAPPAGQQPPAQQPPGQQPPGQQPPAGSGQPGAVARSGYWMLGRDGAVFAFGDARHHGERRSGEAVDLEPTPSGLGYWVVDAAGVVSTHGDASHFGNVARAGLAAGELVTSLSASPSGGGYWVFTSRGRVMAFGDAGHFGDMAAVALNGPVLDSIPTPSGRGYYMVASDGGIFAFGDAGFYGSMGDRPLNAPVRSLVPDGDGAGYWLVASDGGIFAFDAPFRGSMGDVRLNRPVTGMVRFGNGYLMVGEDGGIFNFSDRPFAGSLGDQPPAHPIIAVAPLED